MGKTYILLENLNMNKYVKKAKAIITSNIYMTIASASKSGKPWISPAQKETLYSKICLDTLRSICAF